MVLHSLIPELNTSFGFTSADVVFVYECAMLLLGWSLCLRGGDKNFFHRLNLMANLFLGIAWFSSRYPSLREHPVDSYVLNFTFLFLVYLFTQSLQDFLVHSFHQNRIYNWMVRHRMFLSLFLGLFLSAFSLLQISTLSYIQTAALCALEGVLGMSFQEGYRRHEGSFYTYDDLLKRDAKMSAGKSPAGKEPV